jgi:hypothetical protein
VAEANVRLTVDARNAVQQLQRANTATRNLDTSVKGVSRSAATATANIQRFGIAFRSVIGPLVAITGAVNLASRSLKVLGERQADAAALENGLKKVGAASSELQRLIGIADKLGKATLFNEEDFTKGFALLTSFQSIGVSSYERVAKAAADVAQVTRQDVGSSLLQLAKALQDPERGLTALARSGTQFTEQQKEQIKALVESGRLLEAQNFILLEIEKQYGNAAQAAGSAGYAGAVDSLQESFRDFQERLAEGIQPAVTTFLGTTAQLFDVFSKIPAPVGQAALAIGGATAAVVALNAAVQAFLASRVAAFIGTQIALMRAFGVQIYATAAAQGALTAATKAYQAAVVAAPWALAAVGIGLIISETYKAIAAQAEYNRVLNEAPLNEVNKKIGELREQLTQVTIESQKAAVGMSLMGGSAEFSAPKIAQLNTQLAELVSRQRELALYQQVGVTPQAGFYGPGFAAPPAPPAAPKTVPTAPTGKKATDQLARLSNQVNDYLFAAKNRLAIEKQQNDLDRVRTEADVQRLEISRKYAELTKGVTDATVLNNAAAAKSIELQLVDIQLGKELGVVLDAQAAKLKEQAQLAGDAAIKLQEFAAVKNPIDQLGASIGVTKSEFSSLVSEVARGTATIGDAFQRLANSIIDNLIQIAAQQAVSGLIGLVSSAFNPFASVSKGLSGSGALGGSVSGLGIGGSAAGASYAGATGLTGIGGSVAGSSFGGFQGAFANGGSVMSGKPALVGERGPELFVPGRSGSIIPNNAMGGTNIVVNVSSQGGVSSDGEGADNRRLGEAIGVAVRQELIRQKRPGGLLS